MDMLQLDRAPIFPQMCLCGNTTGPFIDTGMEKPVSGRVYVCRRCTSDIACTSGEWVERTHYEQATAALARSEQEVARLNEALALERRPESKVIRVEEIPAFLASVTDLTKYREKKAAAAKKATSA